MSNPRWSLIQLPLIQDHRGSLSVIEGQRHVPFAIERVYWLYNIPTGLTRAGHAHKQLRQLMVPVTGSFDIHLDDGANKETIHLRRADYGLLMESMVWRELENFSSGAVCVVMASMAYDESDYYRNYEDFDRALKAE